jgi:penicillin-binding protein 1C
MPRREPPPLPECTPAQPTWSADLPQIASPMRGVTYTLRISQPAAIPLQANRTGSGPVYWFANEGLVARSQAGEAQPWTPDSPGRYVLRAVDDRGGADSRIVNVEFVP